MQLFMAIIILSSHLEKAPTSLQVTSSQVTSRLVASPQAVRPFRTTNLQAVEALPRCVEHSIVLQDLCRQLSRKI